MKPKIPENLGLSGIVSGKKGQTSKPKKVQVTQPAKPIMQKRPTQPSKVRPKTQPRPKQKTQPSIPPRVKKEEQTRAQAMKKKRKRRRLWWLLVLIPVIVFLVWLGGYQHFNKAHQVDRLTTNLNNNNITMRTQNNLDLKPLQDYYAKHPAAFQKLKRDLINGKSRIKLIPNGHYFRIYPKYTLRVPQYRVNVQTNHKGSKLMVNDEHYTLPSTSKELDLIPGAYNFVLKYKGQNKDKQVDIWHNSIVVLNVGAKTIKKKSKPAKKAKKSKSSSKLSAAILLKRNFTLPHVNDFVNGQNNQSYRELAGLHRSIHAKRINIRILSKKAYGRHAYLVNYEVNYLYPSGNRQKVTYVQARIINNKIYEIGSGSLNN